MKKQFYILMALVLIASSTWASVTITVGPTGDYTTIQAAINAAPSGAVIEVAAGTYTGSVSINKSLTINGANAGIHPAIGMHPTEIVGTRGSETILAFGNGPGAISVTADNVTLDGFTITSTGTRIIDTYADANYFTMKNCIWTNTSGYAQQGTMQFGGGSHTNMLLEFNQFNNGETALLYTAGTFDALTIQYNYISCEGDAIFWTAAPLVNGVIKGNEIDGTIGGTPGLGGCTVNIGQAGNLQITDNWIHDVNYTAFQVGIIGGSVSGNTFEDVYPYSSDPSLYGGYGFYLWGGAWGTALSENVNIYENEFYFNNSAAGPVRAIRLAGPANDGDPSIDASTIHIYDNKFYNGGLGTAVAIRHQGDQATAVDASLNYWGTSTPDFANLFQGSVNYCPFYSDAAMTTLEGYSVHNINQNTDYCSIQEAVDAADAGDAIEVAAGTYEFTEQMNIGMDGLSISGQGTVIFQANNASWSTTNGYKHLIGIYAGTQSSPITISNITMDCNDQCYGLNTYANAYGILNNVTINNSVAAGLTVNGSTIIATDLNTTDNAWGAVNVDPGSGVTDPSVFTLNSGTLSESNQIWSDGGNVTETATVTVNAPTDYSEYIYDANDVHIWTNRDLTDCATITKNGETRIYSTIQAAIDDATAGDVVNVTAGTFTENIDVDKQLSIIGAGSGDDPTTNTIITQTAAGAGDTKIGVVQLTGSGNSASEPVLLQNIRLEPVGIAGISVGRFTESTGQDISYVELNNVHVYGSYHESPCGEQERGLYVDNTSSLSYLTITNSAFNGLDYGWYLQKLVSADISTVTQVTVTGTEFKDNIAKGLYAEKLDNATFNNCNVIDNGDETWGNLCTYFKPWLAGIDINLKAGAYTNIAFAGCTFTGNGTGEAKEGCALTIKGRDDGSTYGPFPASLTNVTITNCTITGNERGVRFGEPGKLNQTPTNVTITTSAIHSNRKTYTGTDGVAYGDVINQTAYNDQISLDGYGYVLSDQAFWFVQDGESLQTVINTAATSDVIEVAAGTYSENLVVNKALSLNGANANTACASRTSESILNPTSGLPISVTADGVTINGFEITAPTYPNAIVCGNTSDLDIMFNKIHDIYTTGSGSNAHAINYTVANSPAATSDVSISDNCFTDIGNFDNHQKSASAIGVLQSTTTGTLTNLTIDGNTISNVKAKKLDWGSGGRIAYGIQINVGGGSSYLTTTGNVVDAIITDNLISNLEGFISTGIGLEGNTEDAVITGNSVSTLTGYKLADRSGGGYDLNGLKFENNKYVASVTVEGNVFGTDTYVYDGTSNLGYAVANYVPTTVGTADVSCNWFGTATLSEIVDNETLTGKIFNKEDCETNFLPVWISTTGPCSGDGPVANTTQGTTYMTIQSAIDAADAGDVIEVAPGTYIENVEINVPNLTLQSTGGRDVTTITPPTIGQETIGISVKANMGTVTVDGFTADGFRNAICQSHTQSTGTAFIVKNCEVIPENHGTTNAYLRNGIQVTGENSQVIDNIVLGDPLTTSWSSTAIGVLDEASGTLVQGNTITGPAGIGINVQSYSTDNPLVNITILDNSVDGATNGIRLTGSNAAYVINGVVIEDNTITNSPSSAGINVQTVNLEDLTITGNVITGNDYAGVRFSSTSATLSGDILINGNNISGNGDFGIYNGTTHLVDATDNYWDGCPSVSENVTYYPYYTTVSGDAGSFVFSDQITNITAVSDATDNTICAGSSVTLTAGNGSNFVWEGLGLGTSKVVNPTVTTTYNVTGDDLHGCSSGTASVTIIVVDAPTVAISAATVGGTTTLTASGASNYEWNTGDTGSELVVSPTVTTEYTVIGTNDNGCSGSDSYTVNVVSVTIGPDQYINQGSSVTLTATVSGVPSPTYLWSPGGATTDQITVSPVDDTEYTVTVNDTYSASVWVYVNPRPIANAGPDKILVGGSVQLEGSASGGTAPYTYSWTGPSFTSSDQNPLVTAAGTYSLVVTDAYGSSSMADDVEVTAPALNTYTVSGNISYAFNSVNPQMHDVEVTLVGTGGEGTFTGYTAATGDGDYAIAGVPNGIYTVYLNSPKPWGGVTSADVVAIQNHYRARRPRLLQGIKRLAADVVDNSTGIIVNSADRNAVNARRLGNSSSFATGDWVFTRAGDISSTTYPIDYAYTGTTVYSDITIEVNGANLTGQDFKSLCYGDVNASYTGMKDVEIDNSDQDWFALDIYPNPFKQTTNISYYQPIEGQITIQLFDMMGNIVHRFDEVNSIEGDHMLQLNGSNLRAGIYVYVMTLVTDDDVIRQTSRIVITK